MENNIAFNDKKNLTETSNAPMARVIVQPIDSLSDEQVSIEVFGLPVNTAVTIRATLISDSGDTFESFARYVSSDTGVVSLANDRAYGGSYTGVEPMGLLWAMAPVKGQRKGLRLSKRDVTKPYVVNLDVFAGHEDYAQSNPLASGTFRRHFMGEGVRRIPVKSGRIRGTMFIPPGNGPFPGVVDVFGTAGGILEFKAALLASHGYTVLALAYFGYDDLPKVVTDVSLEYFEETVEWLSRHPMVRPGGVGLMGVSKGSELVLALASYKPELVRAIVAVSPAHAIIAIPLMIRGKPSPFVKFEPEFSKVTANGEIEWRDTYEDHVTNDHIWHPAMIAVERIECPILLVCGEDDMNWRSTRMADLIVRRLEKHNKKYLCNVLRYHGAGHLIEPPFTPHCKASYHKTFRMCVHWGGEAKQHCAAQEDSWKKIKNFFQQNLPAASPRSSL